MGHRVEVRHYGLGFAFVLLMVVSATVLHDQELILPEIGALTAGTWIYQNPSWIHQPSKIFLAPSGTAIIGFLINQLPWAYPAKIWLGLLLMLVLLWGLKSNLAPSFATGLLPIIINATHWSFIAAILIFTLCLMLGVYAQGQFRQSAAGEPIQGRHMGLFVVLVSLWVAGVWLAGVPQMAGIPPVLVVFFEVLQKPQYAAKLAGRQWLALTGAATLGFAVHVLIGTWALAALVTLPLVFIWLQVLHLKLPAAYAFPLLALVLPADMFRVLPLSAGLAAAFFLGALLAVHRVRDWWDARTTVENSEVR